MSSNQNMMNFTTKYIFKRYLTGWFTLNSRKKMYKNAIFIILTAIKCLSKQHVLVKKMKHILERLIQKLRQR